MFPTPATLLLFLPFTHSVAGRPLGSRAFRGSTAHRSRLASGAIAGIVIGCIALVFLIFLVYFCVSLRKRRRMGRVTPGSNGMGGGRFGRFGPLGHTGAGPGPTAPGTHNGGFAYAGGQGPSNTQGFVPSGPQSGWNTTSQPAQPGYQPPTGAPLQPGGFVRPEEAHTRPY